MANNQGIKRQEAMSWVEKKIKQNTDRDEIMAQRTHEAAEAEKTNSA